MPRWPCGEWYVGVGRANTFKKVSDSSGRLSVEETPSQTSFGHHVGFYTNNTLLYNLVLINITLYISYQE